MYLDGAETTRLLIRKLEISDIAVWESFFENNSSLPFLGLDLSLDKKAQSKDWIERQNSTCLIGLTCTRAAPECRKHLCQSFYSLIRVLHETIAA